MCKKVWPTHGWDERHAPAAQPARDNIVVLAQALSVLSDEAVERAGCEKPASKQHGGRGKLGRREQSEGRREQTSPRIGRLFLFGTMVRSQHVDPHAETARSKVFGCTPDDADGRCLVGIELYGQRRGKAIIQRKPGSVGSDRAGTHPTGRRGTVRPRRCRLGIRAISIARVGRPGEVGQGVHLIGDVMQSPLRAPLDCFPQDMFGIAPSKGIVRIRNDECLGTALVCTTFEGARESRNQRLGEQTAWVVQERHGIGRNRDDVDVWAQYEMDIKAICSPHVFQSHETHPHTVDRMTYSNKGLRRARYRPIRRC